MKDQQLNNLKNQIFFKSLFIRKYWTIKLLFVLLSLVISSQSLAALNLAIEVTPTNPSPNEIVTVRLIVTNPTGTTANSVRVELFFPGGLYSFRDSSLLDNGDCTVLSGNSGFCDSGETVFWDLGDLSGGERKTVYLPSTIKSTTPNSTNINFSGKAIENGLLQASDSEEIEVVTNKVFNLAINANHDPVAPGSTLSYDLTYGHQGTTATTNTQLRFPLPTGVSFVSADGNGMLTGNNVVWDLGLVNPGESGVHRVTVQLDGGVSIGDILIVENATITGEANFVTQQARAQSATWVGSVLQLGFSIVVNPDPVLSGRLLPLQFKVVNRTNSLLTGVRVELLFPGGLDSFRESSLLDSGDCTVLYGNSGVCDIGETVFWNLGSLAAGVSKTISLTPNVTSNTAGRLLPFMSRAFSNNSSDTWSTDTVSVVTGQTLGLMVDANHDPVAPGSALSYDLTYGHQGTTATTNTQLRFPLPTGVSFVSADGNGILTDNNVVWDIGLVNPGESGVHRVTVQLDGGVSIGDILTVENATITGEANFVTQQARAKSATWVGSVPQLDFSMVVNPNPVSPGEFLNAHLTVTNLSVGLLTDVRVELHFPGGLLDYSEGSLLDGGGCTVLYGNSGVCNSGETVFWNLGILPPGGGKTVSLNPYVSSNTNGRVLSFKGRAFAINTSDQWRQSSVLINTNQAFNLAVDIDQEPVAQVTELQYNLTFGNRSDSTVSNTTLLFPIPEGSSFVSADGDGVVIGNDVVWDIGTLNAGEGSRRQVNLQLDNNVVAGEIVEVNKAIIKADANEEAWATSKQRVKFDSVFNLDLILNPDISLQNNIFSADATIDNLSVGTMTGVDLELNYPDYLFDLSDSSLFDGGDCTSAYGSSSTCDSGETVLWNIGNIQTNISRSVGMNPTIRSGTGEPSDGTVIQFYAKAANAASDRAFVTRSLLVGTYVPPPSPEINIQGNGITIVNGDATPSLSDNTDFGSIYTNTTTQNKTFSILNIGTKVLNLTGNPLVLISGTNASDFTVMTQPSNTIAIGASSDFVISFDPSAIGTRIATVNISSDDEDEMNYTFQILGVGTQPEINIQGNGLSIANGDTTPVETDNTDFGTVDMNGASLNKSFVIQNLGSTTLNLTGVPIVTITGSNDFTVITQPSNSIAASSLSNFTVVFDPSGIGSKVATVTIGNDDQDEGSYTFQIKGKGIDLIFRNGFE